MATGSFIEMFMTTFGWHLYDIIWGVISSTGLAYLPILAAIIDNVVSPIESQDAKSAAVTSLRRLEIDIIRIIVMMMLAVSPMMSLEFGAVSYTKACQNKTYTGGNTGTAFEGVLNDTVINNTKAEVPPWFYIVMSISGGVNDAIIVSLPCELNIREIRYEASTVRITDPHLRRQTQLFVSECYNPARADFFNNARTFPSDLPNEDLDWIGSQYFNDTYYKTNYAKNPVATFPFDASRESDASRVSDGQQTPSSGYPSCYEWWNDSNKGIRQALVKEYPPGNLANLTRVFKGQSRYSAENEAVRQIMRNESDSVMDGLELGQDNPLGDVMSDLSQGDFGGALMNFNQGVVNTVGAGGAALTSMLIKPVLYVVKEMAPYIQAVMLMSIYFLLPWVLLVGNYEWSAIKTSTITIFGIKFWTTIWAVIDLLDNKLTQAIQSASGASIFTLSNAMLEVIIDLLILSLYMGLPFFFLQMLGWAGERGASAGNQAANDQVGSGKSAGNKGSSLAEGAVTK